MSAAAKPETPLETFALQLRPTVTKHLAQVIPKVLDWLTKALQTGQPIIPSICGSVVQVQTGSTGFAAMEMRAQGVPVRLGVRQGSRASMPLV